MKKLLKFSLLSLTGALLLSSCNSGARSDETGWKFNDAKWGGFEKLDYEGQVTGPNLVLIQGGTFTMGQTEQDVMFEWNKMALSTVFA